MKDNQIYSIRIILVPGVIPPGTPKSANDTSEMMNITEKVINEIFYTFVYVKTRAKRRDEKELYVSCSAEWGGIHVPEGVSISQ